MSAYSHQFIPKVVSNFLSAVSGVDIEVITFTSPKAFMIKQLQAAEWDLVLANVADPSEYPPDIEVRSLGTSRTHVYCRGNHPLAKRPEVARG